MAHDELTAAEIAWWAFATVPTENWPPLYDKFGFATFDEVRHDLTEALRGHGLALELVSAADDGNDFEYRVIDADHRHAGRAFILHATDEPPVLPCGQPRSPSSARAGTTHPSDPHHHQLRRSRMPAHITTNHPTEQIPTGWNVSVQDVDDQFGQPVYDRLELSLDVARDGLAKFATDCELRLVETYAAPDGTEFTYDLHEGNEVAVTAHIWRADL